MKAWSMFTHSVRLVLNNLDVALRVSLVLYSIQVISQIYSFSAVNADMTGLVDGTGLPAISAGYVTMSLLLGIASLCAGLWIAVAWHRYVLLGEVPEGWLPKWQGGAIFGYLLRSILVALSIVLALIPVTLIGVVLLPPFVLIAVATGIGGFVFFRLSPTLPAVALGTEMNFGEAWRKTSGDTGTLIGLAGLMILGSLILQIPTLISGDPSSIVSLLYGIVVSWLATMIGISLLTTVYGHYVEGRGID